MLRTLCHYAHWKDVLRLSQANRGLHKELGESGGDALWESLIKRDFPKAWAFARERKVSRVHAKSRLDRCFTVLRTCLRSSSRMWSASIRRGCRGIVCRFDASALLQWFLSCSAP